MSRDIDANADSARKTVVITGADGGMGRATLALLASRGWAILGIDQFRRGVPPSAPLIRHLVADVRSPDLTDSVLRAIEGMPEVAGLVNLVGVSQGAPITDLTDEDWEYSFAVNVTPAMRLIRGLATQLIRNRGSVVNVGSPVGVIGARKPSYAASKAALVGLTMSAARNLGESGVRVNLLLPGPTITFMTDDWSAERRQAIAEGSFLKRLCEPSEIASVIAFLLGSESGSMTGSIVDMTAGSMFGH